MHYTLDFKDFNSHFVAVHLAFVASTDNPVLVMPTWIAGSYLIREFSKNLNAVQYTTQTKSLRAQKIAKNHWQLQAKQGDTIKVSYEVYCFDLSVRTAYVDSLRIFGNFSSFLMYENNLPCTIELCVPNAFFEQNPEAVLACGLRHSCHTTDTGTVYHFKHLPDGTAFNVFEAMDYPFEIAKQQSFEFSIQDVKHRFFVSGKTHMDAERLKDDLQKICQGHVSAMGWLPFDDYTFMTHASQDSYGGLEHINSTALITPRSDLPQNEQTLPSESYQRFLGLCSHEYFHAWWVKSVRPDVMMSSQLQEEAYTPLLWVFEGFTSYVDDLMLYHTKVINKEQYLALLASQIKRYLNNDGRAVQSVAESSFDAWIKLYRPDENSQNSTVSYYNKGALVAWGLDLLLQEHGFGLFDAIRHFGKLAQSSPNKRYGMSTENLSEAMTNFLPQKTWQEFLDNFVYGTQELPLQSWAKSQGLNMQNTSSDVPFGIVCEQKPNGLFITRLPRHSSGTQAGLSVHDTIIAINGLQASKDTLNQAHKTQRPATFCALRQGVLLNFVVAPSTHTSIGEVVLKGEAHWLNKSPNACL